MKHEGLGAEPDTWVQIPAWAFAGCVTVCEYPASSSPAFSSVPATLVVLRKAVGQAYSPVLSCVSKSPSSILTAGSGKIT